MMSPQSDATRYIIPVRGMLDAVLAVSRSVVRIMDGKNPLCSGWFVTPSLVLVPGYAINPRTPFHSLKVEVRTQKRVQAVLRVLETEIMPLPTGADSELSVCLLRVASGGPRSRVLPFSFSPNDIGEQLFIIQFPEGQPTAGISFGRIVSLTESMVSYDTVTAPGSGGAPATDFSGRVLGMHVLADRSNNQGRAINRATLLGVLRDSKHWPAISACHKLADDVAASRKLKKDTPVKLTATVSPDIVKAALRASVERSSLSPIARKALKGLVVDPSAKTWVLRPGERQRAIASVGSLESLRKLRGKAPQRDPVDRAIARILKGPPYRLEGADESELSWWIPATRWFGHVVPDLPSPADVSLMLERRRTRSRLDRMIGPNFVGRRAELKQLRDWFASGGVPLALTGIGGIGKSALVAKFARSLRSTTPILWLDFDRADVGPDDAESVLRALSEQARVQLPDFDFNWTGTGDWKEAAREFGRAFTRAKATDDVPLLVLDSFEAAQAVKRYNELWPVLEGVCEAVPNLRVVVTGRAPVPNLNLRGLKAMSIHLAGLQRTDARQWLKAKGVTSPAVLERVLDLAKGIPLILRLAARYLETGGKASQLPTRLPIEIVAGFLYDRILDRVQDRSLKDLAMGALVLRRISAAMIEPILGGIVKLPPGKPADWFDNLSREMALVESDEELQLRPEVRSATLEWLEKDRLQMVEDIDRRAVKWYRDQANKDRPKVAAELVYHLLRIGEIEEAANAWVEGCQAYLAGAADDLRDSAARAWLLVRMGSEGSETLALFAWEPEAAERIRVARSRGLDRMVTEILRERADRTPSSPLVFHDAYELRRAHKASEALALLVRAGPGKGEVRRDRLILEALLARETSDKARAERCLAEAMTASEPAPQTSAPRVSKELAGLIAARVRLTVNIQREAGLLREQLDKSSAWIIDTTLSPVDVALPMLERELRATRPALEVSRTPFPVSRTGQAQAMLERIERERQQSLPDEEPGFRSLRERLIRKWNAERILTDLNLALESDLDPANEVILVAESGWRRWWLAAQTPFLADAIEIAREYGSADPLALGIIGTLALYASPAGNLEIRSPDDRRLIEVIDECPPLFTLLQDTADKWQRQMEEMGLHVVTETPSQRHRAQRKSESFFDSRSQSMIDRMFQLFMVTPDPLEVMVARVAGTTDRVEKHSIQYMTA